MVLGDAVTKLQTFVWIFNHVSRVMTWSPACSTLEHQTWLNNQSQHDLLYGCVSLSISLDLKLTPVPYTTPKWPIARCKDICDRYCFQKRNNDHFLYSYLPLLSLRWNVLHYLLSRINKLNRDFFALEYFITCLPPWETTWHCIAFILTHVQRWRTSWIRSTRSLTLLHCPRKQTFYLIFYCT